MRKLSWLIFLITLCLVTPLLAGGCGSGTTQAPAATSEPAASVSVSSPADSSPNALEINDALLRHIIATATTTHGKLVLAKPLTAWSHNYDQETPQRNEDGSWKATFWLKESLVKGNELLEPVLSAPVDAKYILTWDVNKEGTQFTPTNDNAKNLEAEISK